MTTKNVTSAIVRTRQLTALWNVMDAVEAIERAIDLAFRGGSLSRSELNELRQAKRNDVQVAKELGATDSEIAEVEAEGRQ
jgi:hypothetical protein